MLFSLAVFLITSVTMLSSRTRAQRWEPLPTCWTCVSRSRILSPAVGIDIEPAYLTAAVRFHDGSVDSLVKVDGGPAYQDLMRALASQQIESSEGSIPYATSQLADQQRLELRSVASWSESVSIIAAALSTLKAAIEPLMEGQPSPSYLPTFPNFAGLSYDLIQEAMKEADLVMIGDERVAPVGAAAAANGIGLCQNFTDVEVCENEEASMPMTRLLAIEYTRVALTITLSPFQPSRKGYDWTIDRAWDLGANARPEDLDSSEDYKEYWRRVRKEIQKIPSHVSSDRPINRVLVMGEAALDPKFLRTMEDALHDVLGDSPPLKTNQKQVVDPTFAAARGAAEFGKRIMEGPDGCAETAICKWWRRWIG